MGVLTQPQSGIRKTIAYWSLKLTDSQTRYAAYDVELLALHRTLMQCAPIVLTSYVTVHTDHRTLTHILHQPTLSSRQFNNLLYISHFDFDIKHIAGAKDVIADCLSRPPGQGETPEELFSLTIMTAGDEGLDAWKTCAQTLYPADEWCDLVLSMIKGDSLEGLSAEEVAKASTRAERFNLSYDYLLVTNARYYLAIHSSTLQSDVCDRFYSNPVGGQFGRERTQDALQRRFYCPRMDRTDRQCIKGCDLCASVKIDLKPPIGPSQPVPIPEERW